MELNHACTIFVLMIFGFEFGCRIFLTCAELVAFAPSRSYGEREFMGQKFWKISRQNHRVWQI